MWTVSCWERVRQTDKQAERKSQKERKHKVNLTCFVDTRTWVTGILK